MNTNELVTALDVEIARLAQIRNLLADIDGNSSTVAIQREAKRRGRPKGSKNKATRFDPEQFVPKRRTMSAAGAMGQVEERGCGGEESAHRGEGSSG